ncbi:MAG TPA: hypothetical protein VLB90_04750 [Pseudomonadales bacterium]|nr:hypothetical protein [Pseudomonadales bacterium]
MANPQKNDSNTVFEEDGAADVFAAVAVIAIVVASVCFWLHGMA